MASDCSLSLAGGEREAAACRGHLSGTHLRPSCLGLQVPEDKRLGEVVDVAQRVKLLVDTTCYMLFRCVWGWGCRSAEFWLAQ